MELRQLRYFVAVAEALNFTRASQTLRVAQPALSRQIRQLEDELGVKLLERGGRGVCLTEPGRAFLAEARAVLDKTELAKRVAQNSNKLHEQPLNVGYVWGLFHTMAPAAVARFRQQHPHSAVHLFDLTATQQAEALKEGRLDVGFIGFADEANSANLEKRGIGTCRFIAALPRNHRAARKHRIALQDLANDFFLVISETNYPGAARFVSEACARAGFRPRVLQSVERGHTILSLVAGNCGVALLPEPLRALPHPGVVFGALAEPPTGELFVAWDASRPSPLRDAFLALV
ncbi:MAG: LysR family transcriptional regulator [Verrucomicrobia bacterium]|nr:LysR family transcriptional regulator [Verrucomicrobiota bacterium]